jgi:hypothetical protein
LNKDIKNLSDKQKKLTHLRELEQSCKTKFKLFKVAELQNAYIELKKLQEEEVDRKVLAAGQQTELDDLKTSIKKLPEEEKAIKNGYEEADANLTRFNRYEELSNSIEKLRIDINELKDFILPEIDDSWKNIIQKIDISTRNNQDIKREIAFAKPYLEKYKTLESIIQNRQKQSEILDELKASLKPRKSC